MHFARDRCHRFKDVVFFHSEEYFQHPHALNCFTKSIKTKRTEQIYSFLLLLLLSFRFCSNDSCTLHFFFLLLSSGLNSIQSERTFLFYPIFSNTFSIKYSNERNKKKIYIYKRMALECILLTVYISYFMEINNLWQ